MFNTPIENRLLTPEAEVEKILEQEIRQGTEEQEENIIEDIKKVPNKFLKNGKKLLFSNHAVFSCYNRKQKTQNFINGAQARSIIALNTNIAKALEAGQRDQFETEDYIVKFVSCKEV